MKIPKQSISVHRISKMKRFGQTPGVSASQCYRCVDSVGRTYCSSSPCPPGFDQYDVVRSLPIIGGHRG